MEASSTTLNITSDQVEDAQQSQPAAVNNHGHSHTYPNFGRYIAGCPACEKKHPNGPPSRKVKPSISPIVHESIRTNRELESALKANAEMQAKLAEMQAREEATKANVSSDAMAQLVQMMLQKEAKVITKEQENERRLAESREQMLKVERERIEQENLRQNACESMGHKKENGRSAVAGQIHNDGLVHTFCQRCFKTFPPYAPRGEAIQNAVM